MKKGLSILFSIFLATALIACSKTNKNVDAVKKDNTILIWSPTDTKEIEDWWVEKINQWNKENPDMKVKREAIDRGDSYSYENKITTAITSNDLPDILYVDGPMVTYYAQNAIIAPLDSYFSQEDKDDFAKSSIDANTYMDKLYAIGATESSVALFYNKDYLDKAGIEYPSDTDIEKAWTQSEFLENAKKLTTDEYVGTNIIMDKGEGIIYALGQLFEENDVSFINSNSSKADGFINSENSIKTAKYLNEFIKNGCANIDPVKDEFLNGKAATMLGGSWNIVDLEKSDINWGISYFPISDSKKAYSPIGDWAATITSNSNNKEKAGKFLSWLMNSDNIATYASAVSKPATRNSSYEKMPEWNEGARLLIKWQLQHTGHSRPKTPSYSVLSTDFSTAMLNIFSGADEKQELDLVAKNYEEAYEQYYAK